MEKTLIIDKLVSNVLHRHKKVENASLNALKTFSRKNPYIIIEYIDNSIQKSQQITQNLLNLYCFLFLEVTKQIKQSKTNETNNIIDMNLKIFVSLQFYYIKSKISDGFQPWEELCQDFITTIDVSKKIYPIILNQSNLYSTYSFITLFHCANFVTDEILKSIDISMIKKPPIFDKLSSLININPEFFIRLLSKLAENKKNEEVSTFLSFQFRYLLQFFLDHPSDENSIKCIELLFDKIYPQACPAHLRYYVTRICTNINNYNNELTASSLSQNQIILIEKMLIKFCSIPDTEIWKKTVDFMLKNMYTAYVIDTQKRLQQNTYINLSYFPIDANEMDPSYSTSNAFKSSIENIKQLCFSFNNSNNQNFEFEATNPLDIVLSSLLAGFDTPKAAFSYRTLSYLLNQMKFSNEQMIMIVSSIMAVVSRNVADPSLCRLSIDVMKLSSNYVSNEDTILLTKYIINSSISMNNSHYLLQTISVNKEFHQIIFNLAAESLFDENKISLLPSLIQTIHLFILILSKNENDEKESENSTHPLVPILLKKSIADKSLLLIRMLSCLMSLGAMHPFVPSMISILSIFFDFTFPLAFDEIKSILEAVTKRISTLQPELQIHLSILNNSNNINSINNNNNRLSEFGSIIMSLLSNIMKLINDSQFRLSLSSAVIHDIEINLYPLHIQNCLWIFDTIIPFLPFDVSSSSIEKFFKIIPFYPFLSQSNSSSSVNSANQNTQSTVESTTAFLSTFADVLGSISGRNYKLIVKLIKKWKEMKSNNAFLVGKKPQPIPYSFIALTLTSISRDVEVPILLDIANTDLFPLLIQLMKRKNAELNPGYCLNVLIELCKRLTFHKVPKSFHLLPNNSASNIEFIFKYILNIFLTHKSISMLKLCLASFRYFIQVPPCLTTEQKMIIKEKVITPQFIMFTVNEKNGSNDSNNKGDQQLFLELRGLLFAMICTLPETATIISLLVSLMPNCQNNEVISLIWRLLSLFDSRREKNKSSNDNNESNSPKNSSPQNEDKSNSYNLIKFYKTCQVLRISILPQIIADLLAAFYKNSSKLALQSIYLLFRIDRNEPDEIMNIKEASSNISASFDDASLISSISDLSNTVFNKLNQTEIDSFLNYSIERMRKIKNMSANYGFAISQLIKFVSPKSKLAVIDSHKEQLCIDVLNNSLISSTMSLTAMQTYISDFVSSIANLIESAESTDSLIISSSLDLVQQLILKYPDVFVKKLVQIGFNEYTSQLILKSLEEETGQCVEIILQHLCLFLLEMPEDDKMLLASEALLFISHIINNSNDKTSTDDNNMKKKFNYEIPAIHIYQIVCSLLIFGFSMNIFINVKEIYTTDLFNKLKNSVSLSSAASSPIMNNSRSQNKQQQQQYKYFFIKVLSLCLSKVQSKSTTAKSNHKIAILPLDASKAFSASISTLIESPNILLLIDVMNFLMSACQLNKSKVSSGIAVFCGEVLNHYDYILSNCENQSINSEDANNEESKASNILNLFYPTLLTFIANFGEFTCIVSLSEITKFITKEYDLNPQNKINEFPIHFISRTLQVILKRCSLSGSSNSSLILTNDVFIAVISCIKQFCKTFAFKFDEEMLSILFDIFIELLKSCGKRYNNQIASIIRDLVVTISKDQEITGQMVKYAVIYNIISYKQQIESNDKKMVIQINENDTKDSEFLGFDIKKEKNEVIFVFEKFLDSSVPFLISSALNLMKESIFNCIIDNFVERIINLLDNQDDNVASSATTIIEISSYFLC